MKIDRLLNDFTESKRFEIKYVNKKLFIYYYDEIVGFNEDLICINVNKKMIKIKGKTLAIDTLYDDYLIIKGDIKSVEF